MARRRRGGRLVNESPQRVRVSSEEERTQVARPLRRGLRGGLRRPVEGRSGRTRPLDPRRSPADLVVAHPAVADGDEVERSRSLTNVIRTARPSSPMTVGRSRPRGRPKSLSGFARIRWWGATDRGLEPRPLGAARAAARPRPLVRPDAASRHARRRSLGRGRGRQAELTMPLRAAARQRSAHHQRSRGRRARTEDDTANRANSMPWPLARARALEVAEDRTVLVDGVEPLSTRGVEALLLLAWSARSAAASQPAARDSGGPDRRDAAAAVRLERASSDFPAWAAIRPCSTSATGRSNEPDAHASRTRGRPPSAENRLPRSARVRALCCGAPRSSRVQAWSSGWSARCWARSRRNRARSTQPVRS